MLSARQIIVISGEILSRKMKRIIILAAAIFCMGCWHGDRNILLRLRYKQGDQVDLKYHFYLVKDDDLDDPVVNGIVRMGLKVDSVVADSLYMMSAKVDYPRVEYSGFSSRDNFSYEGDEPDSSSSQQPGARSAIKSSLERIFKLVINTKGQIIKPFVIGGPAIVQNIEPLNYTNCQVVFPAGKIAVGEDWQSESDSPVINARRFSSYHIESVFDGKIQIKESGTINVKGNPSMVFSERYVLDEKTKNLISAKLELNAGAGLKAVIDIEAKNWGFM